MPYLGVVVQAGAMLGDAFIHQLPHAFGMCHLVLALNIVLRYYAPSTVSCTYTQRIY